MKKMVPIDVTSGKPVYDEKNGNFLGWSLTMLVDVEEVFSPVAYSRFFPESWWSNSYKNMSRFRAKILSQIKQNENTK